MTRGRGGLAVNEAAERLTEGLRVARALPNTKVVFTGGRGTLFGAEGVGASVRKYLIDAGVAPERILIENSSGDTYENAVFTRDLIKPKPDDRWLLITSAYHMPRAVGVFRQVGFDVVPFPVDFRTRNVGDVLIPFTRKYFLLLSHASIFKRASISRRIDKRTDNIGRITSGLES